MMIIFSSYKFFDVMEGSSANVLFQVTAFLKAIMGSVVEVILQL